MEYDIETRCLHLENDLKSYENTGSLFFPIYQTATFVHPGVKSTGYDYSRAANPTRDRVEDIVCSLEGGVKAFAYSSGMAGRLDFLMRTTGAGLAPFDSWLILRGIQTLAVRMDRAYRDKIQRSKVTVYYSSEHLLFRACQDMSQDGISLHFAKQSL